jgi:hypothetical protein
MTDLKRTFSFAVLIACAAMMLSISAGAQDWGYGPVVVFSERDGRGTASSFNVGEYRSNRGEFGTLRNDSASSVSVPAGYRIRLCDSEGRNGQGDGRCEEYGEGNNNLQYQNSASYIRVWGPGGSNGWGGGWNGGGQHGVTVYEDRNARGRSQSFGIGRFLNAGGQLGNLRNDKASSVVVERGFRVRLCDSEGNGDGAGRCETYNEGTYNLQNDDSVSYVEVQRAGRGWGGGNWNNNGGGNGGNWGNNNSNGGNWGNNNNGSGGGLNNDNPVVKVFTGRSQDGEWQGFDVGTYRYDQRQFGTLANDSANSVWVQRGYHVRLCESEAGGSGGGRCEEYGAGSYNLRYPNRASYIRVWRQ